MRILQVIKDLDEGGAQVVVQHLVEELTAAGHEVAVAGMPGRLSPEFHVPQYGLPPTGSNPRLLPAGIRALQTAVRDFRPDIVHAHNPGTVPITAAVTARGRRVPALVTLHGSPQAQYAANARLVKVAGIPTVACGPAVADLMARAGAPVSATVINGVVAEASRGRSEVRAELGLGDTDFVICQVGRLVHQKHPELAVEALAQSQVNAHLLLVGTGELADGVRRLAQDKGVPERVHLLGARPDAADLMAAADVVQLSSRYEGLPLVLLEAMTLGRPVIGTDAPGITELIRDGEDGLLVANESPALADGIRRLATQEGLADRLAAGAQARAAEFTARRMAADYAALYAQLVG